MIAHHGRRARSRPHAATTVATITLLVPLWPATAAAQDGPVASPIGETVAAAVQQQSALVAPMGLEFFVYFAEPVRPESVTSPTDREIQITQEHLEYLELLAEQGRLIMAGPSLDPPYTTIVVFLAAGMEQARRTMESDPAVVGGRFRARLSRFNVFLMPVVEPTPQR